MDTILHSVMIEPKHGSCDGIYVDEDGTDAG
jgi:hypothetical protein